MYNFSYSLDGVGSEDVSIVVMVTHVVFKCSRCLSFSLISSKNQVFKVKFTSLFKL